VDIPFVARQVTEMFAAGIPRRGTGATGPRGRRPARAAAASDSDSK
jgi:hypothetical protein